MSKAYTDIEQSKKLAEILPKESADMYYTCWDIAPDVMVGCKQDYMCYTMCWSLAALIDVLPLVETHKQTDGHKIYYYVDLYMKRKGKEIYLSTERHESLVDACYEMILKLHELNLL